MANKVLIPETVAVKFPTVEVIYPDGSARTLPITAAGSNVKETNSVIPKASLLCLSFRASSQVGNYLYYCLAAFFLFSFCSLQIKCFRVESRAYPLF